MKDKIYQLIIESDSIVIARHKSPDLDAYGSQFGLYYALKNQFPNKQIYAIGDTNSLNSFQKLDEVSKETLSMSLVIILDTVASQMLQSDFYKHAKTLVLIDHHLNDPDISYDVYLKDTHASSASEMVVKLLQEKGIPFTNECARALYMGIVGDTGRFVHSNVTADTFRAAADLLEVGFDLQSIYQLMYVETYFMKKLKAVFSSSILLTKNHVAYRLNDLAFLELYNVDTQTVSRGLVNQMAGIKEIPIWANFTYDIETTKILCEIRSREIPVIEIAKKYGGGGHMLACGCSLNTFEDTEKVLQDLDLLLEEK